MSTFTSIKTDTTFDITIGGSTLVSFQKLLLFLLADKSEAEIQEAYQKIINKDFEEEWVQHYAFLAYMIQYIERVAASKGLSVEETIDDSTKE
jgi:hypothetical protein